MDEYLDKTIITPEVKEKLREEQTRLIKLVAALEGLEKNKDWKVVQELVFEKSLESIERLIMNEALAPTIDPNKIYKLQGEWVWAKQYVDTKKFVEMLSKQLQTIKQKLQ